MDRFSECFEDLPDPRADNALHDLTELLFIALMATLFGLYPFLLKLYADAGYQGLIFQTGLARVCRQVNIEIVRRCDVSKFVVLPKRWIVERTIAWLNRCRRLSKDWECLNRNALAFLRWASVRLMLRRLCQS